ncbi:MAG: IS3 family transposase [Methanomicrobiales archaeon]
MICDADKKEALELVKEASIAGARKSKASELLGLPVRTVERWAKQGVCDNRKGSHPVPANKLSDAEKDEIVKVLESPEFSDSNPNQIVPALADKGIYIASESSFYRILKELSMNKHRQASQLSKHKPPEPYIATCPNQVWSWDITYLPLLIKGTFLYLYMVMDIYSRKIVSYQVYEYESGEIGADLITDGCVRENIVQNQLVLHSDNGAAMKSLTMLAKLQELGVMPSFSRPSVSDDNPYSESLFRTMKYRPQYPEKPFKNLTDARDWTDNFVDWYNNRHLHSGINFVTPFSRHDGDDVDILAKRHQVYIDARAKRPERWSGKTRNWNPVAEVALNKRNNTKIPESCVKKAS